MLFLDFDGVLRPIRERGAVAYAAQMSNREALLWADILSEMLEPYAEVRILVSSDRRFSANDDILTALLGPLGWRFSGIVENYDESSRAKEIWTEASNRRLTRWLAIDDHPSVSEASTNEPRFIVCEPNLGLSSPLVQNEIRKKLLALLGRTGGAH